MQKEKKRVKDWLASFVFLLVSLISLNVLDSLIYDILGVAFLISGLYGLLSIYYKKRFVFGAA